jgi:hypothetical protein
MLKSLVPNFYIYNGAARPSFAAMDAKENQLAADFADEREISNQK